MGLKPIHEFQTGIPSFNLLKLRETASKHHIQNVVYLQPTKRIDHVIGRQKLAEVSQPPATLLIRFPL